LQISFLELEKKWLQDELLELHALVKDVAPLLQKAKFINIPVAKSDHKMPYDNFASVAHGDFVDYQALHDNHVVLLQNKVGLIILRNQSLVSIPEARLIRYLLLLC
jgi:hypothetical protein